MAQYKVLPSGCPSQGEHLCSDFDVAVLNFQTSRYRPRLFQKKEEELPPWIRSERERKLQTEEGSDLPFPVYLIGSALVAIAAVSLSEATAAFQHCKACKARALRFFMGPISA